jgi:hypothetical protein
MWLCKFHLTLARKKRFPKRPHIPNDPG